MLWSSHLIDLLNARAPKVGSVAAFRDAATKFRLFENGVYVMSSILEFKSDPLDPTNNFSPYKILTYPEVLEAARRKNPMRPINLEINPINFCNQSCSWCTYGYLHERREMLPRDKIDELLLDAKEMGVKSVTWTGGGEPTVYKWLYEVASRAAELGLTQGINSNGSNIDQRLRTLIIKSFSYIRFSVDAGTSKIYEETHKVKPDAFDKVIKNIYSLCEERRGINSKLIVGFSFLVDHSNVSDLATAAKLAKSIGVDYFQVKPIVNYTTSNEQFDRSSDLWRLLDDQIEQVADIRSENFRMQVLGHKFSDMLKANEAFGRTYNVCRGNELLATVGADGSVDVCCAFKGEKEWSFGNILTSRFKEIWDGSERLRVLSRIDVHKCPPLCKAHEINKLVHYMNAFDLHREFI